MNWSHLRLLPVCFLIGATQGNICAGADPFVNCTTDASAPAIQPANSPVLLTVRIVNHGDAPLHYSNASGSPYPGAEGILKAKITDGKGATEEISIFNDQDIGGSARPAKLPAGQSIDMPAMIIHGLPVGSYTIQVREGKSVKVTIKDDPDLARKWDEELVGKISKGDQFARHVASVLLQSKKGRPALVVALVRGLSSEDAKEVER